MNFYYRDNIKFLDITVFHKNEYISTRSEQLQTKACTYLRMSLVISCYCIMITIAIDVRFRFSIDNSTDHL